MTTIIAVHGIPAKFAIPEMVRKMARALLVNFVALGFGPLPSKEKGGQDKTMKTIYLRLPISADPYEALDKLNNVGVPHGESFIKVKAFIPSEIPECIQKAKPKQIPLSVRNMLRIREEMQPQQAIKTTYIEILTEMQSKFTQLYNLSNKTGHKLLRQIADVVYTRLCQVMEVYPNGNCFILSKNYRKAHPHFADFELILNTYRQIVPGGHINEQEFTTVTTHPYSIDKVPLNQLKAISNKYGERIVEKVSEHLKNLKTDLDIENDTEEEIARKKVRVELKKLSPYMGAVIRQVIAHNFMPRNSPYHRVRVYGEPFMPPKEALGPLVKRHHAVKVQRSDRMFNLLKMNVPPNQYGSLMAMDGTLLNGAKLVVRSSDMPHYFPKRKVEEEHCEEIGEEMVEDEAMEEDDEGEGEGEDLAERYENY